MPSYLTRFFYPLFLGILFATVFTWPLILKLNTFYTDKGDYPLVGWILWHNQKAITEGFIFDQVRYFDAGQFYPYPYSLAYSEHFFVPSLLFTVFFLYSHNLVLSVNLLLFLSFIFTFLSSYYFTNYFLRNRASSIIGALIFTFNPLTAAHFPDHLHLLGKYFLPLVFLYLYLFLFKTNLKNTLLFFTYFTLNFLTSIHFGIFSTIVAMILILTVILFKLIRKDLINVFRLVSLSLLFSIFLPILFHFNLPYLEFSQKEEVKRPLSEIVHYSARLMDWFSPSKNIIYERYVNWLEVGRNPKEPNGGFNYSEHTLFTNLVPTALFLAGLVYWWKWKRSDKILKKETKIFFISLLTISFIFTFGPTYTGWNGKGGILTLPYTFFYKYLPMMQSIRVPTRFEFIFYIPFALVAAYGFHLLSSRFDRKFLFLLATIILIVLESSQIWSLDSNSQIVAHFNKNLKTQLAFLKGENTLHIPFGANNELQDSRYLTWSTFTSEKIFNGYSGFAPKDRDDLINKIRNLDMKSLEKVAAMNIRYLIFHKVIIPDFTEVYGSHKLYQTGKIYEDNNVYIVDLKKYNFEKSICGKESSLTVQLTSTPHLIKGRENYYFFFTKAKVTNNNSCYYISKYRQRYLPIKSNIREDIIYIKLPVLVDPGEEIVYAI